MGLYDAYKLSNSTDIPKYEGSAGDEFIRVGQYKQGLYDTAQSSGITLGSQANEIRSILPQNQDAVNDLRTSTQTQLQSIAKKGNWEDAIPQIQALGQNFANRAKEIEGVDAQVQEYRTKTLTDEKKNLTPEQQQALLGMSIAGYQGLKKNAQGQYVGAFQGVEPAKNIDVNAKIDEWSKGIAESKQGDSYEHTTDGGMWIYKNGIKREFVDPKRLKALYSIAQDNDTEYQGFKNMQGKIAAFHGSSITDPNLLPDKLSDGSPNSLKSAAIDISSQYGIPFNKAYSLVVEKATHDHIDQSASNYGVLKYSKDNRESEFGMKTNEFTLKNPGGAEGPFIIPGPDSKLTNDEKDYDKLVKNNQEVGSTIIDTQAEISKLTKDLQGNLSASTKTQKQADLANAQSRLDGLQAQKNRSEDIMNYSKDQTARHMGYNDYEDFLTKNKKGLDNTITKLYPNGIMTASGRMISKDELVRAAADDRIKPDVAGGMYANASGDMKGVTITLKDGTKVPISGVKGTSLWDSVATSLQTESKKIVDFNTANKNSHEDNVKDFSIQSPTVQVPKEDREELTNMLKGAKDGIRFSKPGQIEPIKAPDNFRVVSAGAASVGGDSKLQVEELDKDNKPTGNSYDAILPRGNNVTEQLSRKFGDSKNPESKQIADMLDLDSGARRLMTAIPGNTIAAGKVKDSSKPDMGEINTSIKVTRNKDNTISYDLINDSTGDIIKSTNSVGQAGSWMDDIQMKDTYSNGRKKLRIDKGRTKDN